jgi:hypothetical protein
LLVARDNWTRISTDLGAASEWDVLRQRPHAVADKYFESTPAPLLPRVALLDIRERLKLARACYDRVAAMRH